MKSILLSAGVVGLLAGGVMLSGVVNAEQPEHKQHSFGFERSLETKAQVLGLQKDQLQEQLRDKTMAEVAFDQGFDLDSFRAQLQQQREQRWQDMGLSEAEIQERSQAMEERHANCDGVGNADGGEQHRYGRIR